MYGCLTGHGSTISISDIGREFAQRLYAAGKDFEAELYPSAVVIRIFTQLREKLRAHAGPHVGEGSFPTGSFEMIHYRLIIWPFGSDLRDDGHWMGLVS